MPLNINNGEKCVCDKYIYIDGNQEQSCNEYCDNFIYNKKEYEKYCLSSCSFNNEELYSDEENKKCYKECSDNTNGKMYAYLKTCVNQCPQNYTNGQNNICVFDEIENNPLQTSEYLN